MKRIIVIPILLLFVTCSDRDSVSAKLNLFLHANEITQGEEVYVFLPSGTCHPCAEKVLDFIEKSEDLEKIILVVGATSMRGVKGRLGKLANRENVFVDLQNKAFQNGLVGMDATFFYKNGDTYNSYAIAPNLIEKELNNLTSFLKKK